jgi:hypothetical protein
MTISKIQPRLIRHKDAPEFFGVSRVYFDKFIRPSLGEIWWGDTPQSGISFDVLEMEALVVKIVERNGRPAQKGVDEIWDVKQQALSSSSDQALRIGTLRGRSSKDVLDKALEQHLKKKQT